MPIKDVGDLLDNLRGLPKETEWLEFKKNYDKNEDVGEYISALSNGAALKLQRFGYLVYGVDDKSHEIIGTNFKPSTAKKGNEELENWLTVKLEPGVHFEIIEEVVNGKQVVIIQIAAAIGYPTTFSKEAFIRVGSYKKKLKEYRAKEAALWNVLQSNSFEENYALEGLNMAEAIELIDTDAAFMLLNITAPSESEAICEKLINEKILVESQGRYAVTNYGALMFARKLADFPSLARKAPRVVVYKGVSKTTIMRSQSGAKGYATGFEGLNRYINDQLPSVQKIVGAKLVTEYTFSPVAIRELLANAMIHQDFIARGTSPLIEIFPDRVSFTNPGEPLIQTLRFIDSAPKSRNEQVAAGMRRMKYCEELGTGIDRVVQECETLIAPAPLIEAGEDYTRVTLFARRPLAEMDRAERSRAAYLHAALKYIENTQMTNESLRERFGISPRNYPQASRIIRQAIEDGLIKPFNPTSTSKKHSSYVPFWAA